MLIFSIWGVVIFYLGDTFGLSERQLYFYGGMGGFLYVLVQGVIYNNYKVGEAASFLKDLLLSVIPLTVWGVAGVKMYITSTPLNETGMDLYWYYGAACIIDILVFTSGGARLMVFTDKNAPSGN